MSNSKTDIVNLSPNNSGTRTSGICRITPHCVVGQASVEWIGNYFKSPSVEASCNYAIGCDGRTILVVDESKRSWCSSNEDNDQKAVTIECASDSTNPYAMNEKVFAKLISLCTDICKRNGKNKLLWFADKDKSLNYTPKSNEMILTVHRWFANKSCPGDWLYSKLDDVAQQVTKALTSKSQSVSNATYKVIIGESLSKNEATIFSNKLKEKEITNFLVYNSGKYIVQLGVFFSQKNAIDYCKKIKNLGFNAKIISSDEKDLNSIAKEVIAGKWGNGNERIKLLKNKGFSDTQISEIQKIVNKIMEG